MKKHDTPRAHAPPPRGLLRTGASAPQRPDGAIAHTRLLPSTELAPFIAHFWSVTWNLAAPFTTETLSHPSVHVIFEGARAEIAGVPTRRFTRTLSGSGEVFGVKFRPGAFAHLLDRRAGTPMASLTDEVVSIASVFGDEGGAFGNAVLAAPTLDAKIALAEAFFSARVVPLPPDVRALRDLVERIATDHTLLRVDDVGDLIGLGPRALQRSFHRYIGVTPKWVIRRFRMHEAAERLKAPSPPPFAQLAVELGYADQAHFSRDFKQTIGRTPRAFLEMEGALEGASPRG